MTQILPSNHPAYKQTFQIGDFVADYNWLAPEQRELAGKQVVPYLISADKEGLIQIRVKHNGKSLVFERAHLKKCPKIKTREAEEVKSQKPLIPPDTSLLSLCT